jgi:hypothetical protein
LDVAKKTPSWRSWRTVAEEGQRRLPSGAMLSLQRITFVSSSYRPLPRSVVGISMTHKTRRALPRRVRVAPLVDFRSVKWTLLLPLVFVANIAIAAIVWYVVDFLIR